MRPSLRAWFLIIAACVAFNFSVWKTGIVLIGFGIAERFDQWQARKARQEILEDEVDGWEQSELNPGWEEKGGASRVRLTDQNQIIVTRIGELLRRTL